MTVVGHSLGAISIAAWAEHHEPGERAWAAALVAFGPGAAPAHVAFYERMLIECQSDVRAAVGVALSDMGLWQAVARLRIPTLVVAGDHDRLTPPAHARRIASELPQPAGPIELPDTGHMSPLERPRELSNALERLTRDVTVEPGVSGSRF